MMKNKNSKFNEKRIKLPSPYPVKKDEIIDLIERSNRLTHTATDEKTVQLYIYSNGSDRPEYFAEVEITSVGYILHGAEGYDYQGGSFKEFEDDLRDIIFYFDATTSKRFGESKINNKKQLFEAVTTKYMACCYDPEDYYEETNYIDEDGELKCNSSGAKLFDTEDEAIEYADDNKPYGWESFTMPCNTTLNEATIPQIKKFRENTMKKLFDNILNESAKNSELQFIISSYIPSDKIEKWRVEEYKKFDEAIGIGQDVRFKLSELKNLIHSLSGRIVEYKDATEDVPHIVKHKCSFGDVRASMWGQYIIVKYYTTDIYDDGAKSGGYIEIVISLDYDSFEKYLAK